MTHAMTEVDPLDAYGPQDFLAADRECDLVMKGGVTSGLVYPYAVLELAKAYRFRSIGGTSAGAIAAAFAAAAEYARTVRGDPDGLIRLKRYCDALPERLGHLFQPAPPFVTLMRALLGAQSARGPVAAVWALLAPFWIWIALGLGLGGTIMALLQGGPAGIALGALVGMVAMLIHQIVGLIGELSRRSFGLCPGSTQPGGKGPGLTDWLHAAIQDIAFGDPDHSEVLTFGALAGVDPDRPVINLRMVTTNLSMRRPHTLPVMRMTTGFDPVHWAGLFPSSVMTHLTTVTAPLGRYPSHHAFPSPGDLPVVVGVRMSLSFPVLFAAIPLVARDMESAAVVEATGGEPQIAWKRLWFSDGGLSSNFPIHLFDALLPSRPTFALSLDALPPGAREDGERVVIPQGAGDGVGLPVHGIGGLGGFLMAILGATKDWQDNLLAGLPGQRERIARVFLAPNEGGLNLTMPAERARGLMRYGQTVGRRFADGAFDFDEHRWRRALSAYEQLEQAVHATEAVWDQGGFDRFMATYPMAPPPDGTRSYAAVGQGDRRNIRARLAAFAGLARKFDPRIRNPDGKFPRPAGRLRIGPDF